MLEEENEDVFESFVHHLYHSGAELDVDYDNEDTESFLIEAHIFGDRRGCNSFRNAAVNALAMLLRSERKTLPSMSTCDLIFTQTTEHAGLRYLVADKWCWEGNEDFTRKVNTNEAVNADFAIAVFRAMTRCNKSRLQPENSLQTAFMKSAAPFKPIWLCELYHNHNEDDDDDCC